MSVHISACWPFPWTDPCTDLDISSSFDGLDCPRTCDWKGGGSNLSDKGLNLSGSWQQGHSATYNTPSRFYPPLGGNYNSRRSERRFHGNGLSQRHMPLGAEAPTEGRQSGGGRMRRF
ncbi:unnamed protein product [Brassica rapa]|uniref:Uncharacterized protein n=1 Tax=Brassica campestris TaxID=3711 RepID=A0A8D9GT25_BRACM|nr:unnamed protein product [Brassica rapa]